MSLLMSKVGKVQKSPKSIFVQLQNLRLLIDDSARGDFHLPQTPGRH